MREKVAFQEDSIKAALARSGCGLEKGSPVCSEMVILSTCNRVELYAVRQDNQAEPLVNFFAELKQLSKEEISENLYYFQDDEAVEHLKVAVTIGGLRSDNDWDLLLLKVLQRMV